MHAYDLTVTMKVPLSKELPIQPGAPRGSAWGVFDTDGKRDFYGTLNFITPGSWSEQEKKFR